MREILVCVCVCGRAVYVCVYKRERGGDKERLRPTWTSMDTDLTYHTLFFSAPSIHSFITRPPFRGVTAVSHPDRKLPKSRREGKGGRHSTSMLRLKQKILGIGRLELELGGGREREKKRALSTTLFH